MHEIWVRLDDLPAEGREFDFPEQEFWVEGFAAFNLEAAPGKNIDATAHVLPQGKDALIRGTLTASIMLCCDRCAERFEHELNVSFNEFESLETEADGEESRIKNDKGVLTLDIGAVLWEQLVLALPLKPVCGETCEGVCSRCGANRNEGTCSCEQNENDSRLAVFRDLKLK